MKNYEPSEQSSLDINIFNELETWCTRFWIKSFENVSVLLQRKGSEILKLIKVKREFLKKERRNSYLTNDH